MSSALSLRAALKQGALVTAANWPVILIEFALWSLYELALGVPVLGGAFMLAVLLGFDLDGLIGLGLTGTADLIFGSLGAAPVALGSFFLAVGIVAAGGITLVFVVKAGTLAVLVAGERAAADLHRAPTHVAAIQRASAFTIAAVYAGTRRYGGRGARLAAWLSLTYLVIVVAGYGAVTLGFRIVADSAWEGAWPLLVALTASAVMLAVIVTNLVFDLARVVVVTDDCRVSEAFRRARQFVVRDARHVLGIFAVTSVLGLVAAAAWLVATANIAFIGFVPVVGLLVAPLQAALWIVRGLLFQYLGLVTLVAYQTQYRRFREPGVTSSAAPFRTHHA